MHVTGLFLKIQRVWLFALLALIPVSVSYIVREPLGITPLNLLSVGFIGLGIINLLTGALSLKKVEPRSLVAVITLLAIAFIYALFFTQPLTNALGFWVSRFVQPILVGFFIYQLFKNEVISLEFCLRALLFSVLTLLVAMLFQVAGAIPYVDSGRISAFYVSANSLARFLAFVLLITLPWLLFGLPKNKIALWVVWAIGLAMLLPTFSYGGVLTFGVGFVVLFACLPAAFNRFKWAVLGVTALVTIIVATNAPRLPNWETKINESRLSRLEFWDIAEQTIQDNFWTGIGIKGWETQYPLLVQKYRTSLPMNWISSQPHNNYLDMFLKAGVVGFVAIMALVLWPLGQGARLLKLYAQKDQPWWFGLSALAYGAAVLALGVIDDPLWSDDIALILWVVLFLAAAVYTKLSRHD